LMFVCVCVCVCVCLLLPQLIDAVKAGDKAAVVNILEAKGDPNEINEVRVQDHRRARGPRFDR
jgi:hypothetical protein